MKKTSRRIGALLLCLIMCLSFAGCSVELSEALLLKKAYDAILTVNSFAFSAEAEATGSYGKEDMALSAKAEGECIIDPLTASAELELDMGEQGTMSAPVCLVSIDGKPELYIGLGIGGATVWVSLDSVSAEKMFSGGFQELLGYMKNSSDPISGGEHKQINGSKATAVTVTIPGELLALTDESGKKIDGEQPLGGLAVTVWLDDESYLPLRLEADMAPLASYYLSVSESTAAMPLTVKTLPLTVDFSDYNSITSIELPSGFSSVTNAASSAAASPEPSAEPSPEASAQPSPEASAQPSPKASAEPSPKA